VFSIRLGKIAILFAVACFVADVPAHAQTWGDLLGAIIQKGMVDNAIKKWTEVDPEIRQCLANNYGLNVAQLAQNAVTPDDWRLKNQMQYCAQVVAQARALAEQQRLAAIAEQQRRDEAEHMAQEEEAKRQAAARAEVQARHNSLVAKFGSSQADAIEKGKVTIGMSKDAVIASRGQPSEKQVIPGGRDEMWIYGSQRVAISNGKVTFVEH
jgi:hypothetical protein